MKVTKAQMEKEARSNNGVVTVSSWDKLRYRAVMDWQSKGMITVLDSHKDSYCTSRISPMFGKTHEGWTKTVKLNWLALEDGRISK